MEETVKAAYRVQEGPGGIIEELRKGVEWHEARIHDPFHDPSGAKAVLL